MQGNETEVEVHVDCNRSQVEFVAPEGYQYDATVAVMDLTVTGNAVARSTIGLVEGNETVDFDGEGIVFAFVQSQEGDEQLVASDVTTCPSDEGEANATTQPDDAELAIEIDCNESDVRFTASEGTEYVAKVVAVEVSPTDTSTRSVTRTLEGNETVSVDEEDALVAVYASTGDLGDDRTVSAIRNCSPYDDERISGETTSGDRDDETET